VGKTEENEQKTDWEANGEFAACLGYNEVHIFLQNQ